MILKEKKGITLIALVITIIIMLIMAMITINLTLGKDGLIQRAKEAKIESEKANVKEKLELAIMDIKATKISNNQIMERDDLKQLENIGATIENIGIPTEGEINNYYFEIDENYNVEVIGNFKGEKPTIEAVVLTTGIVKPGETVEIKVNASINDGDIVAIEARNGAILKSENSNNEKIFTVNKNGTYLFKAKADNGRSSITSVEVYTIIDDVVIKINDINETSCKIDVEKGYSEQEVKEYKYYINNEEKFSGKDRSYLETELFEDTTYEIFVELYIEGIEEPIKSNTETIKTPISTNRLYLIKDGKINKELIGEWEGKTYYERETGVLTEEEGYVQYKGGDCTTIYVMTTKNIVDYNEYSRLKLDACVYQTLYKYEQHGHVRCGMTISKSNFDLNNYNLQFPYCNAQLLNLEERGSITAIIDNSIEGLYPCFGIHRCNIKVYNMYFY